MKAFYRKVKKKEGQYLEVEIGRYDNEKFSSTHVIKKIEPGWDVIGEVDGKHEVFSNVPDMVDIPEEGMEIIYSGRNYYIKPLAPVGYVSPPEKIFYVNKIRKEFKTIP